MKRLVTLIATSTSLAIATLVVPDGPLATAAPAPTYRASVGADGHSIHIDVRDAHFAVSGDTLTVRTTDDTVPVNVPLSLEFDGGSIGLTPAISPDARSVDLEVELPDIAQAARITGLTPAHAPYNTLVAAYNDMAFHITNGWARSGAFDARAGSGIGASVGVIGGAIVGFLLAGGIPGLVALGAVGAASGAAIGGVTGALVGTGHGDPRAAQSVANYVNALYRYFT